MAVNGGNFPVGTVRNMFADKLGFGRGKQYIRVHSDGQDPGFDIRKRLFYTVTSSANIVAVHCFGKDPIGEGIKSVGKLISLISQVRADFKIIPIFTKVILVLEEGQRMSITKHSYGSCRFQALFSRLRMMLSPSAICFYGHSLGFVKTNNPRRSLCVGGQNHCVLQFSPQGKCPFERNLPTQRAADNSVYLLDPKMFP